MSTPEIIDYDQNVERLDEKFQMKFIGQYFRIIGTEESTDGLKWREMSLDVS